MNDQKGKKEIIYTGLVNLANFVAVNAPEELNSNNVSIFDDVAASFDEENEQQPRKAQINESYLIYREIISIKTENQRERINACKPLILAIKEIIKKIHVY